MRRSPRRRSHADRGDVSPPRGCICVVQLLAALLCLTCSLLLVQKLIVPKSLSDGAAPRGGGGGSALSDASVVVPRGGWKPVVVILGHDRFDHVVRLMRELDGQPQFFLRHFYVVVSLDGRSAPSSKVMVRIDAALADLRSAGCAGTEVWRPKSPPSSDDVAWWRELGAVRDATERATFAIARHYRTALNRAFAATGSLPRFTHAVMVEDDLSIAPDFLELFVSTAWRLDAEPNALWCVSAWNDLGLKHVLGTKAITQRSIGELGRTTFFPGLGWMLRASLWTEQLRAAWPRRPSTGWDHWMRLDSQHRGRACVVPTVSRVRHLPGRGTHLLDPTLLARRAFAGDHVGLGNVGDHPLLPAAAAAGNQKRFDAVLHRSVAHAARVQSLHELTVSGSSGEVLVLPFLREHFAPLAKRLGIFRNPMRGAYRGLIGPLRLDLAALRRSEVLQTSAYAQRAYRGVGAGEGAEVVNLLLADRRECDFLEPTERFERAPGAEVFGGELGESCSQVCTRKGRRCDDAQLLFANKCSLLRKHFPCENGCTHQVGAEIPCYVDDASRNTHHQCLVTWEMFPTCDIFASFSKRLCVCT